MDYSSTFIAFFLQTFNYVKNIIGLNINHFKITYVFPYPFISIDIIIDRGIFLIMNDIKLHPFSIPLRYRYT